MKNTIENPTIEPKTSCVEENLQNVNSEQSFIDEISDIAVDDAFDNAFDEYTGNSFINED